MGKKAAILTVHKGINIGSYLQAYALKTTVEKLGHEVKIIDNGARRPWHMMLSEIKNSLLHGDFKKALFAYRLYSAFIREHKKFDEIPLEKANGFDRVILGSDEIWNVSRSVMSPYHSFFGEGISASKTAYAPSVNNAEFSDMNKEYIINSLKNIEHISVRYRHSADLVKELVGRDAQIVCDPTWLLTPGEYPALKPSKNYGKYILVYMYNSDIEKSETEQMRSIAKKHGFTLISANNSHEWCDKVIITSPFEYLGMLSGAQLVFTNTFHGTILSILFNKPFVSFEKNNRKISEILEYTNLTGRKAINPTDIENIAQSPVDWENVNKTVGELRKKSMDFLERSI